MGVLFVTTALSADKNETKIQAQIKPNLYAVIVGVDKFADEKLYLKYAKADTVLFGKTLQANSGALFNEIHTIYLNDSNTTGKKSIVEALKNLQNISKKDLFIFYGTSFARIIDEEYYFIPSDTKSMHDEDIRNDALSRSELIDIFSKIPSKNKLFVFDTCYPSIGVDLRYSAQEKPNIASISASNSKQTALKISLNNHSVFADVVTDAIAGMADLNGDGTVLSTEFLSYVYTTASRDVAKLKHSQVPAFYQGGDVFALSSSAKFTPVVVVKEVEPKPAPKSVPKAPEVKKVAKVVPEVIKPPVVKPIVKKIPLKQIEKKVLQKTQKKTQVMLDKYKFIIEDNSLFIDVKRKIKQNFNFTNDKGEHYIVFEFYTNRFMKHAVKSVDSKRISKVKIGYHGDSFRIALLMKSPTIYKYQVKEDGIHIKLKDKK